MNWLNKLPNSRREPPGLEWRLLKRLPRLLLAGTAIPLSFALAAHLVPPDLPAVALSGHLQLVNIVATAVVLTVWTAIFTVGIGCFVVMVMKGPAYVADRYDVSDAEQPRRD